MSSRLRLLSAVLLLSSEALPAAIAAEFSFHETPPRGIPGSFWATEVINGSRLAIDSWLTPPRDCETRLWQASLDQSCSPERQAVFDGAIDEAFQIWQTQAVAAVRATGGTAQSSCETSARLIHRDVRGVSAENRDDRLMELTRAFSPAAPASLPTPDLPTFSRQLLEIQGNVPHSIELFRERVCAAPESDRRFVVTQPVGTTLLDLLVAQKAATGGGTAWLCAQPPVRLIDEVIAQTHSSLLEQKRRGIEPDFALDLQSTLGSVLHLYFTPGGPESSTTSALIRREVNRTLETDCPETGSPERIQCACRMALAFTEMERTLRGLEQRYADRLERIRTRSRERYLDMIARSNLSPALRAAIQKKYINAFPPLRLSPDFSINASYSRSERTNEEAFEINLGTLLLPEETILDLFDHENGHFFAYSIESADLQSALTAKDVALLQSVQDCADRSVALGEFRVEMQEGVTTPGRKEHRSRVMMKRDEALGDIFLRGQRRLNPASPSSRQIPLEGLFCSGLQTRLAERYRSILPESSEAPRAPAPSDTHVNDSHAREGWRIPWLAASLNPTLGERGAAPKAAACERLLWTEASDVR